MPIGRSRQHSVIIPSSGETLLASQRTEECGAKLCTLAYKFISKVHTCDASNVSPDEGIVVILYPAGHARKSLVVDRTVQ